MTQTSLVLIDNKTYLHSLTPADPFLLREPRTRDHLARSNGGTVGLFKTLAQIDRKIRRLKQARALLQGSPSLSQTRKRNLTPDCRRRMAKALKRHLALKNEAAVIEAKGGWVTGNRPATHLAYQPPQF